MKNIYPKCEEFIFSIVATDKNESDDEFVIEFFEYSSDMKCEGKPKVVTKNFDELIDFLEAIE